MYVYVFFRIPKQSIKTDVTKLSKGHLPMNEKIRYAHYQELTVLMHQATVTNDVVGKKFKLQSDVIYRYVIMCSTLL